MTGTMSHATMETAPVTSPKLQDTPGIVHGFSTRYGGVSTVYRTDLPANGGDLNLGYSEHDDAANVRINRGRWLCALGIAQDALRYMLLRQEHTAIVHAIDSTDEAVADFMQPGTLRGDGLVTNVPGVLLTVQTADCVPVLLCDPACRVVGAFHAGWRGTLTRIVEHGIEMMQERYGTRPADVIAAIGPSIGPESYVVSSEVQQSFAERFDYAAHLFRSVEERVYLNLWEANRRQLLCAGVAANNIDVIGRDTAAETNNFFSYRTEHGRTGRMMSSIGLRP